MDSCPKELEPYDKAHKQQLIEKDSLIHLWVGTYGVSALSVAISKCFSKNSNAKYIENPILEEIIRNNELTQEELDNRELQRMILAEEQWIKNDLRRGLAETIIK